jgi:hypothetical protein
MNAQTVPKREIRVMVAVATGENYNSNRHAQKTGRSEDYAPAAGAATFFLVALRFSTGGCLSLFFNAGKAIEVTNFFSP